jgi:hypothetical protein
MTRVGQVMAARSAAVVKGWAPDDMKRERAATERGSSESTTVRARSRIAGGRVSRRGTRASMPSVGARRAARRATPLPKEMPPTAARARSR